MLYLNHAGTSWPKPTPVSEAVQSATAAAPPQWPELFRTSFDTVARFFHVESSSLVLTPSCTSALNLAVMDQDWKPANRIITSSFEHHALYRNLIKLQNVGIETVTIPPSGNEPMDLDQLEVELKKEDTSLVAVTAACNVTGGLLPYRQIIKLAHRYGTKVLLDGAQIAGWLDIDLVELGVDFFTFAGHKGPQAPWGIGGLYVSEHAAMRCPKASCELNLKIKKDYDSKPGYCDAGSVNLFALAGLAAGCQWLARTEQQTRLKMARQAASNFADAIRHLPGCTLFHDLDYEFKMPTVAASFGEANKRIGAQLAKNQIIVSNGFQCSPQAHKSLQTQEHGVLRFSFGPNQKEIDAKEVAKLIEAS